MHAETTTTMARPGALPQFSLRAVFGATTWIASIAGLAVSHFAGWTMFAVGISLASFNCAGWLAPCQTQTMQRQLFRAAWLLLIASMFLPAVQGCGKVTYPGWSAAVICCEAPLLPLFGEDVEVTDWFGYALYCLLSLANLLLAFSPWFLWRLQRGKGRWYGAMLVTAVPAMWCFSIQDSVKLLIGYYVWCAAGLAILCAFRLRWAMLPLTVVALVLIRFAP